MATPERGCEERRSDARVGGAAGDPRARFTDRVGEYVRGRPGYPEGALDAALGGLGGAAGVGSLVGVDVGSGTGISTRQLAARGVRVIGIEPNAAMRAAAEREAGGAPGRVEYRDGSGEATGLGEGVADLVLCAQAFHWLDSAAARGEFFRVLRPGGRACVLWNLGDPGDAFTRGYYDAVLSTPEARELARAWGERDPFEGDGRWRSRLMLFDHGQRLDRDGLRARALSASYVPKSGAAHERIMGEIDRLYREHAGEDGLVHMRYVTRVYLAERVG